MPVKFRDPTIPRPLTFVPGPVNPESVGVMGFPSAWGNRVNGQVLAPGLEGNNMAGNVGAAFVYGDWTRPPEDTAEIANHEIFHQKSFLTPPPVLDHNLLGTALEMRLPSSAWMSSEELMANVYGAEQIPYSRNAQRVRALRDNFGREDFTREVRQEPTQYNRVLTDINAIALGLK